MNDEAERVSRVYLPGEWALIDRFRGAAASDLPVNSFWPDLRPVMNALASQRSESLIEKMRRALMEIR